MDASERQKLEADLSAYLDGELDAQRADAVPAVFTRINMHFIVTGVGLKESQVKRAVELSAEKYCSASIMLGAAGLGQLILFAVPQAIASLALARAETRLATLKGNLEKLKTIWGPDVSTTKSIQKIMGGEQ